MEFVTGNRFEPTGWDWAILFNAALLPGTALAADQCRRRQVPYVLFPVFWDLRSIIPKGQRQALSRLLPADSARRRAVSQRVRAKGNELRRSEVGSENVDGGNRQLVGQWCRAPQLFAPTVMLRLPTSPVICAPLQMRGGSWSATVSGGTRSRAEWRGPTGRTRSCAWAGSAHGRIRWYWYKQLESRGSRCGWSDRRKSWTRHSAVIAAAGDDTVIEGFRPRTEVLKLLASVRAHAQVGFMETPGLATLEAVAAGSSAVVATSPVVEEYLPEGVWRIDPVRSLRSPPACSLRLRRGLTPPWPKGCARLTIGRLCCNPWLTFLGLGW